MSREEGVCWVLSGPTAVGKTQVSLELARLFPIEIVSVDSMQVYKGMDIGTAKPTPQELAQVPHHMVDVVEPEEPFSVGRFCSMALRAIEQIRSRGRRPLLVCGTPLYLKGLLWGLFDGPAADAGLRARLREEVLSVGTAGLHRRLAQVDPVAAERIDPNDFRRIERALEVYELTGEPISARQHQFSSPPRLPHSIVALTRPRAELYDRIDRRVDAMMRRGLLEEVRSLAGKPGRQAGQAVGYKELAAHLRGEMGLEAAVALIKRNTRRLAKHQMTWLRHFPQVEWVDLEDGQPPAEAATQCAGLLEHLDPVGGLGYHDARTT